MRCLRWSAGTRAARGLGFSVGCGVGAARKGSLPALARIGVGVRMASGDAAGGAALKKTPLYDLHVAHGAKMVPFAGYSLPMQYQDSSLSDSHHFTRKHASIFDVSHMVQHVFRGPGAVDFLERITPSSWHDLPRMEGKLTTLLWDKTGGIVDDCIVTRLGDEEFFVVTNGACLEKDVGFIRQELERLKLQDMVEWCVLQNAGLVALQGPGAAKVLSKVLASDIGLDTFYFGSSRWADLKWSEAAEPHPVLISRGGYTGEDGFEMALDLANKAAPTAAVVEALLKAGGPESVRLAGLGARDSLRLEAGMCLYGHDLDDSTTPVEAGLSWVVSPGRRTTAASFNGAEKIIKQLTPRSKGGSGVERRRVGLLVQGAPAREGAEIQHDGQKVGVVTSGGPSPTLGKNIAMGYVKDGLHKPDTRLDVLVRGRKREAIVTKMPFVPANYHRAVRK
ncbi:hypothetical protein CDD81_7795 [Ophiocordyceps australis]|uniref:Aminomethyltransferase n=1 Tax=Ophiocordyceps australis TaxID=1399860 RepID=A0A2C5XZK6_9HYPO|nr:hypothetical protein CDD81_7795 [Ophiocordyceps australis]